MTKTIALTVSDEIRKEMMSHKKINFSKVFQEAIVKRMDRYDQNISEINDLEKRRAELIQSVENIDDRLESL